MVSFTSHESVRAPDQFAEVVSCRSSVSCFSYAFFFFVSIWRILARKVGSISDKKKGGEKRNQLNSHLEKSVNSISWERARELRMRPVVLQSGPQRNHNALVIMSFPPRTPWRTNRCMFPWLPTIKGEGLKGFCKPVRLCTHSCG